MALDPAKLWFFCSLPGGHVYIPESRNGGFVERLRDGDAAEFFILDESGQYQEFNFAPTGAWWSMTFPSYRNMAPDPRRPVLLDHAVKVKDDGSWEVLAAIDRASLEVELNASSRLHISGMFYSNEPVFMSSNPIAGIEPDYHHEGCFQGIILDSSSFLGD